MALAPLPFRARKRFILHGEEVRPGDVVDVSELSATRVRLMEQTNYGMRIAAEGGDHVQEVRPSEASDLPSSVSGDAPPADGLEEALDDLEVLERLQAEGEALVEVEEPEPKAERATARVGTPSRSRRSARTKGK